MTDKIIMPNLREYRDAIRDIVLLELELELLKNGYGDLDDKVYRIINKIRERYKIKGK